MKASNVGDTIIGPVMECLAHHAGQRVSATFVASWTGMDLRPIRRALGELSAKGVLRSAPADKAKHIHNFWRASDTVAEAEGQPKPPKPRGEIAAPREVNIVGKLDPTILRPLIREGAGLGTSPEVVIHPSIYDQVRP